MNIGRTILVIIVAGVASGQLLPAQTIIPDASAIRALVAARSLKCTFPWYASALWDLDQPQIKRASQTGFGFHVDGIDYHKGSARGIGNVGSADLMAIQGSESVSFIERTLVGSLNVTTVYAWRTKAGHFKAVHSRHVAIAGPYPSQNYGYCQVW